MSNVAVVLPQIPREDWQSHPRFRTQALLLGSHANFRRVSRFLIDHAAHENRVLHALRAHDRTLGAHLDVEEDAVVPLLLALDPEEFDRYYHSPISMLIPAEPR